MSQPVTSIAPHTFIKGELRVDGPAVMAGHMQGNITAAAALEIAAEGIVDGAIRGTTVTIHGMVKGDITASQACRLGATARRGGEPVYGESGDGGRGAVHWPGVRRGNGRAGAPPHEAGPAQEEVEGGGLRPSDAAEEAAALRAVEATITRVERVAARMEAPARAVAATVTIPAAPAMPTVQILAENVQAALQRGPRIIKAR